MGRLATILSGLALLAAVAATIFLLTVPIYQGIETVQTESGFETIQVTETLAAVNGKWVIFLLVGITLASGIPFFVALARPASQRLVTWLIALLLMAFSILGSLTVGVFFMPSAILLLLSAMMTLFIRKDAPH